MLTLPNTITIFRIFFIVPLVICLTQVRHNDYYRYACLFIIIVIGFSDVLDGYIARKRNEISNLGKYLDPVADKLVLVISCIILSMDHIWPEPRFPNWIPVLIVSRHIFILIGSLVLVYYAGQKDYPPLCQPTKLGKFATFFQILAVITILIGNHIPFPVLVMIWRTAVVTTLVSGIFYLYRGVRQL